MLNLDPRGQPCLCATAHLNCGRTATVRHFHCLTHRERIVAKLNLNIPKPSAASASPYSSSNSVTFLLLTHQTLIPIVDCSVRCLFIQIFFIAVIYIAGMCVHRSIQLSKVFQLFSTLIFNLSSLPSSSPRSMIVFYVLC